MFIYGTVELLTFVIVYWLENQPTNFSQNVVQAREGRCGDQQNEQQTDKAQSCTFVGKNVILSAFCALYTWVFSSMILAISHAIARYTHCFVTNIIVCFIRDGSVFLDQHL